MTERLTLAAAGYRVVIDPAHGASVLSADWTDTDGREHAVLAPLETPEIKLNAGCFVMAPFANRIEAGRFSFDGREVQLPLNNPAEGMASHGFSRGRTWRVEAVDAASATLVDEVSQDDIAYRYRVTERVEVSAEGIFIGLTVRNIGRAPLPFGIGLHPWFPRTAGVTLQFDAKGHYDRDARGLPFGALRGDPLFVAGDVPLSGMERVDAAFVGWDREARIRRPEDGITITLRATGAFRYLHVFVPEDREIFCAEPVSHLPDAINRPALEGQMQVLAPDEEMSGGMWLIAG